VADAPHSPLWKIDGYTKIRDALCRNLQLTPRTNFFEFPYDWRRTGLVAARNRAAVGAVAERVANGPASRRPPGAGAFYGRPGSSLSRAARRLAIDACAGHVRHALSRLGEGARILANGYAQQIDR
jgi:hypothetical protein